MSHFDPSHAAAPRPDAQESPLVTAIVTTRNKESHIRECLSGLMEQSVAEKMEVIVLDQGSEQSETAIVADLQRCHRNLLLIRTAASEEPHAGLNLALEIASGRYVTVLDATDRMRDDAYLILASALDQRPDAMLAYGDTCFTAIEHQSFANHTSYGKMIWPDYSLEQLGQAAEVAPHPMWRREVVDGIAGIGRGNDFLADLLLRVAERFAIVHVPEFTGLKLTAAAGAPSRESARPATQQYQVPPQHLMPQQREHRPAAAAPAAAVVQSAAAILSAPIKPEGPLPQPQELPEMGADEAFAALGEVIAGDDARKGADALESHLQRHPLHAIAHNDLAAIYYRLGEKEKALQHYRQAVQLAPEESTYQKNLADMLYVEAGEVDEAINIYLQLHKKAPRDVETLLNLGIICEGVGQPGEADLFYQRALEIEPWNQTARERLTELRERQAEGEAETDEEAEFPEEMYERAQEMVAQGNLEGATAALEKLVAAYPQFAPAHNDLAVLYYQGGEKDQALAHYEKAAELAPGNSTFQKNLADYYFVEGGNVDGAIAIYLEELRKEPRNVETLMSLGKICTMLDRPEEAETFYGRVTEIEPWNQDARDCLSNLRRCANG